MHNTAKHHLEIVAHPLGLRSLLLSGGELLAEGFDQLNQV